MISFSNSQHRSITDRFADDVQVQKVIQESQLKEHALPGGKLPIEKDGKIEWVLASELLAEQRAVKNDCSNTQKNQ